MIREELRAKGTGLTEGERYLSRLCHKSFLWLWSYPSVHKNQGKGQEVCDLLVVFENDVIIFSDKTCAFPDSGDIENDWKRWYRRAFTESAKQLLGAERWIRYHPDRLFLDPTCSVPFPLTIPPSPMLHRVAVVHGIAEHCDAHFGGGSGSLLVSSGIDVADKIPFCVNLTLESGEFVHLFDDTSLDLVLGTLDTISDFVRYLTQKEKLFRSRPVMACGEEELLAFYVMHENENEEHDFVLKPEQEGEQPIQFNEGFWEKFCQDDLRLNQIEADKISYAWDELIEKFTFHFLTGTVESGSITELLPYEKALRLLAREKRVHRRYLAESLLGLSERTPADRISSRTCLPFGSGGTTYLFLVVPQLEMAEVEYRDFRLGLLRAKCRVLKLQFPFLQDVIGIATDSGETDDLCEDLVHLDPGLWDELAIAEAEEDKEILEALDLLGSPERIVVEPMIKYPME